MRHIIIATIGLLLAAGFASGCKSTGKAQQSETDNTETIDAPAKFNADSAYDYVKKQVDFGPRVPGTPAHKKCAD